MQFEGQGGSDVKRKKSTPTLTFEGQVSAG